MLDLRSRQEPDPSTIRPLAVLIQTLDFLKNKWRQEGNYPYICDQFKSMRQDLTVQRIKNYFTIQVYEIHARIAMESVRFSALPAFKAIILSELRLTCGWTSF